MGYNTLYTINTMDNQISEFVGFDPFNCASVNWGSHNKDMKDFSRLHPDTLFILEGVGEDHPDIWRKYYRNGLMDKVNAKITFPEFDEYELA